MSSKNRKYNWLWNLLAGAAPFAVIFGLIMLFGQCNSNARREKLNGIWMIPLNGKIYLMTHSNMSTGGKVHTENYYFRLIDPETGKIEYQRKMNVSTGSIDIECLTPTSLWVKKWNNLYCLDFPSMKTRWNRKEFNAHLEKTFPEIGKVFKSEFNNGLIHVTNTRGEEFNYPPEKFETADTNQNKWRIMFLNDYNQMGRLVGYPIPHKTEPETITIEMGTVEAPVITHDMTLVEKLEADTGFARNYAVFTPDSTCFFFDGNKLRTLQKLVNDSFALVWDTLFNGKTWLEADMLRPFKRYKDVPENRFINTYENIMFIHYQTSLDEKENTSRLTGTDYKTEKILWDVDLTPYKITRSYRPVQNFVFKKILITVWMNNGDNAIITGMDPLTGMVIWKIAK